jgi:uncharacterized repeat protein (TIGR03806 family)
MRQPVRATPLRSSLFGTLVVAALGVGACGDDEPGPGLDAAAGDDAGAEDAAANGPDTGSRDGGSAADTGAADAGTLGLDERPVNATCTAPPRPPTSDLAVTTEVAYPDLPRFARPLMARPSPVRSADRWYVIEQRGRLLRFEDRPDVDAFDVALDLRPQVDSNANEEGLLGFAFHPDFETNGRLFVSYTGFDRAGAPRSFVSELSSSDGGLTFDPGSEQILLSIDKPFDNHNGGHIEFGPDGYLYVATGDGGSGGDPLNSGQDTSTLLGAILRVDVDGDAPYAIPPDNPFADGEGGLPEIYAYGLRNPWRFSFDRLTGELWAGDVGQNRREEIDRIERGGNYGWRLMEGDQCFVRGCDPSGLQLPVWTYPHSEGRSVTGGYVYRGSALPELVGAYLYADFVSGRVWALTPDAETGGWSNALLFTSSSVSSFVENEAGELYLLDLSAGVMRQIVRDGDPPTPGAFPEQLSETGCVDPDDPTQPAAGLVPYAPAATLWSDGAVKRRWAALPDETRATFDADGDLEFPPGTVLVKTFVVGDLNVETRLFIRHDDGGWAGYSYAWDEAQTDATLVAQQAVVDFVDPAWTIPSRAQCMQCHTAAAGFSLGLEAAQLQHDLRYPSTGRTAEQLATWVGVGLTDGSAPEVPALPAYDDSSAPVADRARAYLHVNCANCHQPDGPGRGDLDLRFGTPLGQTGLCAAPRDGDLGIADARLVAAGAPERSVLLERMARRDVYGMPPLATEQVDDAAVQLVADWIQALSSCP